MELLVNVLFSFYENRIKEKDTSRWVCDPTWHSNITTEMVEDSILHYDEKAHFLIKYLMLNVKISLKIELMKNFFSTISISCD